MFKTKIGNLIPVMLWLEWLAIADANVLGLLIGEHCQICSKSWQVESCDLLVQKLGQKVDLVLVPLGLLPIVQQIKLSKCLVGERARHHKRRVASGATQIQQTSAGQNNHTVSIREHEAINLRLNVLNPDALKALESGHVDLVVEVANVADNGVVLHLLHVFESDDVEVASGRSEDINFTHDVFHGHDLETLHACLQSANRIALGHQHTSTATAEGKGATLSNIAVAAHQGALASNHDISGAHDAIRERVPAAVNVVKLGLGDAVVDVDGREKELTLVCHLLQPVDTSGGLLAHTLADCGHLGPLLGVDTDGVLDGLKDALELRVGGAVWVRQRAILLKLLLEFLALVDEHGGITAVIDDLIRAVSTGPGEHLLSAPPVLGKGLTLPGEHGGSASLGDGRRGMVLCAEDVARAPAHLGSQGMHGLNEDTSL